LLPDGRKLKTLAEAMAWLAKEIPKSEHKMDKVPAAAHCVTRAAEHGGPIIFAQMGMPAHRCLRCWWSRSLSAGLRTPIADLPLLPILDSEILDSPTRFQLRDQPARLLATTGPSLWRLIRIAVFWRYRRVRPTVWHWSSQKLQALFQSQFFLLDSLLQQLRDLKVQRP
jgi:hypothetical protein